MSKAPHRDEVFVAGGQPSYRVLLIEMSCTLRR